MICPQLFKNMMRNTAKKPTGSNHFTAAEQPIWETARECFRQTHCGRETGSPQPLPAHLRPVFFTDAPWWVAISGYFSNDFHPASWAQFRGRQLAELSRMDPSKAACLPDLDCTALFEPCPEVSTPPVPLPCWFPSSLNSFHFLTLPCPAMSSLCNHLTPSLHLLSRLTPWMPRQWGWSENNIPGMEKISVKSSSSSAPS